MITRISTIFLMVILLTSAISGSLIGENIWIKESHATANQLFAVTYSQSGGKIATYEITTAGVISAVATATFEASQYVNGATKQIDGDTLVAAYRGTGNVLEVTTMDIDFTTGAITIKDNETIDTDAANYISLQKRDSDTLVIVYSDGGTDDMTAQTINIDSAGQITAVASLQLDDTGSTNQESFKIDDDTFGVIYADGGTDNLQTFDVSADGLTITKVETFTGLYTGSSGTGEAIAVDSDTFAYSFLDAASKGGIVTIDITTGGDIQNPVEETAIYNTAVTVAAQGAFSQAFKVEDNKIGILYPDADDDMVIRTITIADDGDITDTAGVADIIASFEIEDNGDAQEPNVINVSGNTWAVVYVNAGTNAKLQTITIGAGGTPIANVASATVNAASSATVDIFEITDTTTTTTTSSNSGDSTAPTLGTSSTGQKLIDNGFVYNDNPVDVKNFKTHYPLVRTPVGEKNTLDLKIFENQGMNALKFVSVHFGVPQINAQGEAIVTYYPGTKITKVHDPNNLLGDVGIELKPVKCKDDSQKTECVNVSLDHTFNEAPLHDMIRVTIADKKLNHADVFFNDGVEVFGDSLNPANTAQIASQGKDRGLVYLTQTDRAQEIWVDQYDNTWIKNSMGNFIMQPLDEFTHPDDNPVSENGYKRIHSYFDTYKAGQELYAKQIWNGILIQSELPEAFETAPYGPILGGENPALQKDIQKQIENAELKWDSQKIQTPIDDYITIEFSRTSENTSLQNDKVVQIIIAQELFDSIYQFKTSEQQNEVQYNLATKYVPFGKIKIDSQYLDELRMAEFEKAKQMLDEQYDPTRFFKYR